MKDNYNKYFYLGDQDNSRWRMLVGGLAGGSLIALTSAVSNLYTAKDSENKGTSNSLYVGAGALLGAGAILLYKEIIYPLIKGKGREIIMPKATFEEQLELVALYDTLSLSRRRVVLGQDNITGHLGDAKDRAITFLQNLRSDRNFIEQANLLFQKLAQQLGQLQQPVQPQQMQDQRPPAEERLARQFRRRGRR